MLIIYCYLLSILSGVLIVLSMPTIDLWYLAWFAMVPLLLALKFKKRNNSSLAIILPFALIWSVNLHSWYSDFFGGWGYFLMVAVGFWYSFMILSGLKLQSRLSGVLALLALPICWTAFEFIKYIAPLVEDWWFVFLANSQWRFPEGLQIVSITGFPGLSFLIMLCNVSLTEIIYGFYKKRRTFIPGVVALVIIGLVIGWGFWRVPEGDAGKMVTVAGIQDLANQDAEIKQLSKDYKTVEGPYADTLAMSQKIFDVDAQLTREAVEQGAQIVVWPENEFADADNLEFKNQLQTLARELNIYIVADMIWETERGLHDSAVLIGPDNGEIGRRAKINLVDSERNYGLKPGSEDFKDFRAFETEYGDVGLGVCFDRHKLWIVRNLARVGANLMLMPVDDDFKANKKFPYLHAADSVFRAVENGANFVQGTTNGVSLIVDRYGRIQGEGRVNERMVVVGKVPVVSHGVQTIYTRFGDWFGWLCVIFTFLMGCYAWKNKYKKS